MTLITYIMSNIQSESAKQDEQQCQDQRRTKRNRNRATMIRLTIQVAVHIFCIAIYLIPILKPNEYAGPTLDELHIMNPDHHDIHDTNRSLATIFSNDYWGRSMYAENSHKSYRPFTILSFRYLKGQYHNPKSNQQLTTHRIVNIITHAATGEMVGILATQLFPFLKYPFILRLFVKILFCFHPTHVEVTANAANRNHILAVLFSTIICFPSSPKGITTDTTTTTTVPWWLFLPTLIAGYLASETFLFQVPAAMVTMIVIAYNNTKLLQSNNRQTAKEQPKAVVWDYFSTMLSQLPRILILTISIPVYYFGRWYYDTLDIPEGLIRPAENPFYHFIGIHRIRNYLYVITIHIRKSWGVVFPNLIGFSHEYGYDCIPALENWNDERFISVYILGVILLVSIIVAIICLFSRRPAASTVVGNDNKNNSTFNTHGLIFGIIAIHWSWMLTLFPVSGLVKVGTFVSDRIVVASTVSVSWILGLITYEYLTKYMKKLPFQPLQVILIGWFLVTSYSTIHLRTLDWMDSISLLNSALETCPQFAKAHMEISKIHSGLYPKLLNLTKSRHHLEIARSIDPELCDVHQQFAHVAIQEGRYREYEEELTQAVLCPFSMSGALPMWQKYWQIAIESTPTGTPQRAEIEERQRYYYNVIQQAVMEASNKAG